MASSYAQAVRNGTMAASRLHLQLGDQSVVVELGSNIDVFAAIVGFEVPLIFKPLAGLLGAYLPQPIPGVLITTERPLSIQRFTAAHELGHFYLRHSPSLDDESILRRMTGQSLGNDFQEVEADAFAVGFMMPRWLVASHCARQGWQSKELADAQCVYQLSLRLGASYEATTWTLQRYKFILPDIGHRLRTVQPRQLKVALLEDYQPQDYKGDVWVLTERDEGLQIDGSAIDHFILRLKEHSGSGFLWNIDELIKSGFSIIKDKCAATGGEEVGGPVLRSVTAKSETKHTGLLSLTEERPWQTGEPLSMFSMRYDLSGPEKEGLSRVERRQQLKAA